MNWLILIIITALSPHWDAHMNFRLSVPELCLIRFYVRDQTGLLSSDFVGQYTLPFTSLKKGEPHGRKEGEGAGGLGVRWGAKLHQVTLCGHLCVSLPSHPQHNWSGLRCFYRNASTYIYGAHAFSSYIYISFNVLLPSTSSRLPLGAPSVPRRMQPGSSLPLRLCLVFLKTALHIRHTYTHSLPTDREAWLMQQQQHQIYK